MSHIHWEFNSVCPKCGYVNHVSAPAGEHLVRVHCRHCAHGYDYTHVVREHTEIEDRDEPENAGDKP